MQGQGFNMVRGVMHENGSTEGLADPLCSVSKPTNGFERDLQQSLLRATIYWTSIEM